MEEAPQRSGHGLSCWILRSVWTTVANIEFEFCVFLSGARS